MDDFERQMKTGFLDEADQLLTGAEQCFLGLERSGPSASHFELFFRVAHNIKGSAAVAGFDELSRFAHDLEPLIVKIQRQELALSSSVVSLLLSCNDQLRLMVKGLKADFGTRFDNVELTARMSNAVRGAEAPAPGADLESIPVSLDRLDGLINNVGELVIAQSFLSEYKESLGSMADDVRLQNKISELEKIICEIQGISMSLRRVPLRQTFQKIQRIVRDTAKALDKEVIFLTVGDDTEIDKTVLDRIGDPLAHLIRNAVEHGLESTQERKAAKKAPAGTIQLSAHHRGGSIVIEVRDDGRGLEPGKLLPMDVVDTKIKQLQGTIHTETEAGQGSCFRIFLPLTLAVVNGMVVRVGKERYVVPLSNVSESIRPQHENISMRAGEADTLSHRGETMPVFRLAELLGRPNNRPHASEGIALVVRDLKEHPFSLLVDDILGSQQLVIKPLGSDLAGLPGIAGGAILGDGAPVLILDINQIIEACV